MFSWISTIIHQGGLLGVFVAMTIENLIPVIPSELIMPMAGFEAALGAMSPVGVVIAGTAGSIVGAVFWFWFGRWIGLERLQHWADDYGRWLTVSPEEVMLADRWFQRWGSAIVCVGRCLPGIRGFICIPAGVSTISFWTFLVWSSLGSLLWSTLLTIAGYLLGQHYDVVRVWLNPITDLVIASCIITYVFRVITYDRKTSAESKEQP